MLPRTSALGTPAYFARWQEEGVFEQLNSLLRRQVRRQEGRDEEWSACVVECPFLNRPSGSLATRRLARGRPSLPAGTASSLARAA